MATFRKRGAYQWEAQIRRRGYPAQSRTFETKAEAEAWANMIESEMSRGAWVSRGEAEATTLYEALSRYETDIVPGKKGAEQEGYFLGRLKAEDIAKRPLATIRSADIAALRDRWLKSYKPATVLRRLATLSHLFNVARKEWGMESLSNPVALVRKPQPNNARTRRIAVSEPAPGSDDDTANTTRNASNDELQRIIAASKSEVLPQIVLLAVETAMRRGELLSLLWENVDLKKRVAHLPETKNGNSRDVPLSSLAVEILRDVPPNADSAESKATRTGPIFSIRGDAVTKAFERAVDRARQFYVRECMESGLRPDPRYLADLRFHDLRHEATSRLAEIFPLHELTKITGHKDPRMLMRYYHPRAEELAKRLQ